MASPEGWPLFADAWYCAQPNERIFQASCKQIATTTLLILDSVRQECLRSKAQPLKHRAGTLMLRHHLRHFRGKKIATSKRVLPDYPNSLAG